MSQHAKTTVLKAARVFTSTNDAMILNGAVTFADGQIIDVSADTEAAAAYGPNTTVVDYGDCTVMPGLIDTHCHVTLAGDRRSYEDMVAEGNEMMALVAVKQLRTHLESGVTTIRDNGGKDRIPFIVREGARRGYYIAPRMLLSGRPVTHTAGHFHWCNGVADGEEAIRAAVRELVADGADHIKIMASGGGTGGNIPYLASYTTEEMRVAVQTAHHLERLTTAHARAASSMVNGINAGLDCLEHGEFLVKSPIHNHGSGIAASALMAYDPAITESLLDSGTFLSFTMQAGGYDTLLELRNALEAGESLSAQERAQADELERFFEMKSHVLARLLSDGAEPNISISTDAGPFDASFGHLDYGLRLAVAAGMSATAALRACTSVAARICGIHETVGTLEPSKAADLVVVNGDPTRDIARIADVVDVYLAGERVPRTGNRIPVVPEALPVGLC